MKLLIYISLAICFSAILAVNFQVNFSQVDITLSEIQNSAFASSGEGGDDYAERGTAKGSWCEHENPDGTTVRFWVQNCPGIFGPKDCYPSECPLC